MDKWESVRDCLKVLISRQRERVCDTGSNSGSTSKREGEGDIEGRGEKEVLSSSLKLHSQLILPPYLPLEPLPSPTSLDINNR